ncbi:MAG: MMPL family transporter, partial [Gammaproteobacteria bacterium]
MKEGLPARAAPLLLWLVILAAAAFSLATGGGLRTDMTAFMPRSKDPTEALLVALLREGPAARTVLMGIEHGARTDDQDDEVQLPELTRKFARALRDSGEFDRVAHGEAPDLAALEGLFEHRYLLAPSPRGEPGRDPFTQSALRAALEARLVELRSALGVFDKSRLAADPTAAFTRLLLNLRQSGGPDRGDGVWTSADGRRTLIVAETAARGYDLEAQTRAVASARAAFEQSGGGTARLLMSGPPAFAVVASSAIRTEAMVLGTGASVLLAGFLLMVYGSARMVVLGAVPVASGMLVGAAAVNLVYDGIHGVTLAFGVTLLGVTLDYPVHLFSHATGTSSVRSSAKTIWPTLRLGALTSVLAFASLGLSRFAGMAELALFAASGLVAASVCTRYVLPAMFPSEWDYARSLPRLLARRAAPTARARRLRLVVAMALA